MQPPTSPIRSSILTNFVQASMRRSILRAPAIAFIQRSNAQSPLIRRQPNFRTAVCDGDIDDCPICIASIKVADKIAILPCRHVFHEACLAPWFQQHNSCPTCRAES